MIRLETAWHSLRYDFLAILFVISAALLTVALNSLSKYSLFAFFYAAVALSSWCGGTRSGIVATLFALVIFNYFFTPPFYSLALQSVDEIIRATVFVLVSLLIGSLNANLKTARQKLERQVQVLGESETRYRALTENIPQIIWFADADGAIEYLNQRWYDYTGLSSLESLGWKWQQVVHPEDLSFVLQQWTSAVEQRSLLEIESRLQGKDGDYHWHITRAVPVVDGNGVIQRWFGSTTDINEQKQIQQLLYQQEQERSRLLLKLEEKQQRLQAILEQMPAGLIIADISGKLLLGNPQVEQIWRHSFLPVESIEQYQEYQGFHLDGRPYSPHDWPLARAVSTGEVVVNEEINFLRGDGTQGWMLVNSAPIRDSKGEITAGVVTFYDITERKQAQEALRESEERFRQMAEAIEDVFWVITIIPGDYRVIYVSPAYAKIWGHSCESLYSNPYGWIDSIHPEDQPRVRAEFFRRSLHGNTDMEYRIVRPDGSMRWIRDRSFPIPDANGNIYRQVGVAEDITDRKQTEIALKESQALFASFMQHIPGSAYIKDEEGKYVYMNQVGANLVGKDIADVIGKTDFDLLPIAVAHKFYECDRAIRQNHQPVELQQSFPQGDAELHFMTYKFPFIDETGRKMLAGMSFDITEQKRLEKALKISETKFRRLVDADIIGVVVANSTHIIEANDLFLQMLGYIPDDVNNGNLRWRDITPPEYWHLDEQGVVELQTTGKCTPFTKEYIRQDGSRVPILLGATILAECPLTWLCFVLDLTPQQQAEIALRQSEERFRLAAQAVAGIVYDWNLQTGYVYRSEGLYRVIGFHPEEVPETNTWWTERVHPEDLANCQPIWLAVATGNNDRYSAEYRVRHKDGHWVYLWDQGYLIRDQDGNIVRVVGSSADISDRKQVEAERLELLEREQIARTKAEEANRIKDEFLAVLSHELRSPLNPILGWSKLLRSRKLDQATVNNALETIERNAKLQTKLIDDLLDVSRILRGKLTLKTNPVNLVSIITDALETVRLAAEAKSLEIQTIVDDVGIVLGDAARLQQIVWNLLSNAVKFTPSGGKIVIKLTKIDYQAQLQVIDTGIGIDSQFLPHIFDYFRQADSSITRNFGGLGLGLAIVRHLVELHGGTIIAESSGQGKGAKFTVQLPLQAQDDTEKLRNQDSDFTYLCLDNVRIITVDDDPDTRDYVTCALEQAGAEVLVATSAAEVLQVISQSQIDILLADIGMPDIDGYSLMRQIRELPPTQGGNIPAIALSAYTRDSDQQQAILAGFQQHISKPIDPFELAQVIANLLRQQ